MSTPLPLVPGTLDVDCYPSSAQAFYEEMFAKGSATSPDVTGILIQDAAPDPIYRGVKGWIPTSGGVQIYPGYVFTWNTVVGHWTVPHPDEPSGDVRRIYVGTAASLATYDGGDAGAPGSWSGPMWEIDTDFAGRFPVGVGAIPGSAPSASIVNPGDTSDSLGNSGEYQHTLSEAEGASGSHVHPIGLTNQSGGGNADDAAFIYVNPPVAVTAYTGFYITGGDGVVTGNYAQANLFTGKAANNAGVVPDPHNNMPPYRGVYFIKRTARVGFVEG